MIILIFGLVIFFLMILVMTAWLASYLTKKYIEKKIIEDLTFPFRDIKNHSNEINKKMCKNSQYLEYPEFFGIPKKNCYEYSFAKFLSTLCENVSDTNCSNAQFPLPPFFSKDYVVLKIPNKSANYGYLFYSPIYRTTFLIWSGSVTFQMWKKDTQAYLVSFPDYITTDKTIRVHEGFLQIYESTRNAILEAYKLESKHFVIAGDSLGGGLSSISAFDLFNVIDTHFVVYTFGSPRCGNIQFADTYDKKVKSLNSTSMRIFNTEDIVPTIPPSSLANAHYTHVGSPVPFTANLGSIANNHIEAYLSYLPEKLVC